MFKGKPAKPAKGQKKWDRNGKPMTNAEWTKYRGNREYYIIREYENDIFGANVEWIGHVDDPINVPQEYWKLFKVNCYNIIVTGDRPGSFVKKKIPDAEFEKYFAKEVDAVAYYCEVLIKNGNATVSQDYEGEGELVEIDNKLAKVKEEPPAPDAPKTKSKIVGSW